MEFGEPRLLRYEFPLRSQIAIIGALLAVFADPPAASARGAGCEKAADCKGSRICVKRVCIDPPLVRVCGKDIDCPADEVCVSKVCMLPETSEPETTSVQTPSSQPSEEPGAPMNRLAPEPATAPSPAPDQSTEYFPFVAGRELRYQAKGKEAVYLVSNVQVRDNNMAQTAVLETHSSVLGNFTYRILVSRGSDGITEFRVSTLPFGGERESLSAVLRFPLKVGKTWKDESTGATQKVVSLRATVEVPAGTYSNCLEIATTYKGARIGSTFYAPGVGMVKDPTWGIS